MTAVPTSRHVQATEDDANTSLFPVDDIRKNLEKEFATPQVPQRLSQADADSEYIKIFVRVRPFTEVEKEINEDQKCMEISGDSCTLTLRAPKESNKFKTSCRGVGETMQTYSFTKIFPPCTGQKQFFDGTALKIVQDFIEGKNSLIFTYGVTCSGKTYTIQGSPGNEGMMPRAVDVIFNSIGEQLIEDSNLHLQSANNVVLVSDEEKEKLLEEKNEVLQLAESIDEIETSAPKDSLDPTLEMSESSEMDQTARCSSISTNCSIADGRSKSKRLSFLEFADHVADNSCFDVSSQGPVKFVMFVSFIEIYKEYIYDLFTPLPKGRMKKRNALRLAEDRTIPFVKDLREIQVHSRAEVYKLLTIGRNHLHMAETKLNQNSSRSHCIFTIKTVRTTDFENPNQAKVTQLSFCDLAGSERWGKTNSFGERLKEAGNINKSLMTLGKCIEALRHNQHHKSSQRMVPYRESRLTRLFQRFLMGHGRACMIVNVNQCASMFDETSAALKFSAIASEVKTSEKPLVRKSYRASARVSRLSSTRSSANKPITSKPQRFTIGWEPAQTPIKEEETDLGENKENSSEEESEEEESCSGDESGESDDDSEEADKKVLLINKLRKSLKEEKEKSLKREEDTRAECYKTMSSQFDTINQQWEERLERQLNDLEEYGEEKYERAVTMANERIKKLFDENISLKKRIEELDKECDEIDDKFEASAKECNDLKSTIKDKDDEINNLKQEVVKYKRSSTAQDRDEFIGCLQKENNDGREIIQEQLMQMEEMREELQKNEEEKEQLTRELEKLQNLFDEVKSGKQNIATEVESLKSDLENVRGELQINAELHVKTQASHADEVKCLNDEINEKTRLCENSKTNYQRLIDGLTTELKDCKSHLEILKVDLETTHANADSGSSELKCCKAEIERLTLKCQKSDSDLEKATIDLEKSQIALKKIEGQLTQANCDLEQRKVDLDEAGVKIAEVERTAEHNKEIVIVEMSELKSETEQTVAKNNELTTALEEALVCAEIKNNESETLKEKLGEEMLEKNKLEKDIKNLQEEREEINEKINQEKKEREDIETKFVDFKKEREAMDAETKKEMKEIVKRANEKLETLQREHENEMREIKRTHKKELLNINANVQSASDETDSIRKELSMANKLETQLLAEIDRLQKQADDLEGQKTKQVKQEEKRTSHASELTQDLNILTLERDDLLKTVDELRKELSKVVKEKHELENNLPKLNVAEASEVEKLKATLQEMDELQEKQQNVIERLEEGKVEFERSTVEFHEKIDDLQKENQKLSQSLSEMSASRDEAESSRSNLADGFHKRDLQFKELEAELLRQQQDHDKEKRKHDSQKKEITSLRGEVEKAVESKEKELEKFRETRDRISSALETQINSQKSCNRVLKEKLNEQIEENVRLKSINSGLNAELSVLQSKVGKPMRKSASASAIMRPIKEEIRSPVREVPITPDVVSMPPMELPPTSGSRTPMDGSRTPTNEEVVTMLDMSTGTGGTPLAPQVDEKRESNENIDPEEAKTTRPKGRTTRASTRQPVVKKTSSRRKRTAAARPATPIPSDINDEPAEIAPKTRRKRTTKNTSAISIKCESVSETTDQDDTLTNQVLDDSDLVRATGNSQKFPKSEMEIDVTPQLKKTTRGRKRTLRQKDDSKNDCFKRSPSELKSQLSKRLKVIDRFFVLDTSDTSNDAESVTTKPKTRRGKNAQTSQDDDAISVTSKTRNISRMGQIIKNSPVGQALKRIEAAISPSRSPSVANPGPTALSYHENHRQSTRRVRKLHAEDISLPLECTPDESDAIGAVGRGVGVLAQTQNASSPGITRKLRRRK